MRLDRFVIGSTKDSPTHRFRNLKNVCIDFDERHWVTVIIGWNGTGKSNVLEALATLFRDLIMENRTPPFAYRLCYWVGTGESAKTVYLVADPDRTRDQITAFCAKGRRSVRGEDPVYKLPPEFEKLPVSKLVEPDSGYLPKYIFSYYSGLSRRMYEVFRPYLEAYDGKLRRGEDPGLKRLFYALPVHSQFVLLAFLTQQNQAVRKVLDEHLGLDPEDGVESVLFVLKEPPWESRAPDGDPRVWNARGVVSDFLGRLYEFALAPVTVKRRVAVSLWNRETLEFKYLYLKDTSALKGVVGDRTPARFFRDLESTHVSQLIDEVRIRVRLRKNDGTVTFRELSEGEQQLLTVLGLLRFTAEEESLFLLDEPDTHLNPRWSVDYLSYLRDFVGSDSGVQENSHVVLTTHNPLAIAELDREQVQILQLKNGPGSREVVAIHPEVDPRGLGYAAIVTSDMFGIASSLDVSTQKLLEEQRAYAAKVDLSATERADLRRINVELDRLGFRFFHPDDEYSRYLRLRNEALVRRLGTDEPGALAEYAARMNREEREDLARRLIDTLEESEEESH